VIAAEARWRSWLAPALAPLMAKELIELAGAKRTYVLRVGYALTMITLFVMLHGGVFARLARGDTSVLGEGRALFDALVLWQFVAIYLLLPAMVAPQVPLEEEQGNLDVLMCTRLTRVEIVLSKLLPRLVVMGSFLLTTLPLMALAYLLGGVERERLGVAAVCLGAATIQVGAWSMWRGAKVHGTARALLSAYVIGLSTLFIVVPWLTMIAWSLCGLSRQPSGIAAVMYGELVRTPDIGRALIAGVPILVSAVLFLVFACRALERRSQTISPDMERHLGRFRPRLVGRRNGRWIVQRWRGMKRSVPTHQPVAWRELQRLPEPVRERSAFSSKFAVWVLPWLVLAVPLDLSIGMQRSVAVACVVSFFMAAAIVLVVAHATGLFSVERARATVGLLLISPMSTRVIVEEKMVASEQVCRMAGWLIAMAVAAEWLVELARPRLETLFVEPALALAAAWVLPRLAAWAALVVGVYIGQRLQATVTGLVLLIAWCVAPVLGASVAQASGAPEAVAQAIGALSPAYLVALIEWTQTWRTLPVAAGALLLQSGVLVALRGAALRRSDALLARLG